MISKKSLPLILLTGYLVLIFIASSIPGNRLAPSSLFTQDKLIHILMYSVVGLLTTWTMVRYQVFSNRKNRQVGAILLIGMVYAASDEYHQSFVPLRTMELYDFLADVLGVLLGMGVFYVLLTLRAAKTGDIE